MKNNIEIRLSVSGHDVVFKYGGITVPNDGKLRGVATMYIDGVEIEKARGTTVKNPDLNRFYVACMACCIKAGYKRMIEMRNKFKSEKGISLISSKTWFEFYKYNEADETQKLYDDIEKALEPYKERLYFVCDRK